MSSVILEPAVGRTCVSNAFIDSYMPMATPVYALLYIFALRQLSEGRRVLTTSEMADVFHVLESDVHNAWRYWHKEGLVRFQEREDGESSLQFLPVPTPLNAVEPAVSVEPDKTPENETVLSGPEPKPEPELRNNLFVLPTRPQYTLEELEIYQKTSREIEHLFKHAEDALGKLLTYNDLNVIFSFYDWLRLPLGVIELLLDYCTDQGHRRLNYIEKVAVDWAEQRIDTREKAAAYLKSFQQERRSQQQVLTAFGLAGREPNKTQKEHITRWLTEYGLPLELVTDACEQAYMKTGKANFAYADKILLNWRDQGFTTIEQTRREAEAHAQKTVQARPVAMEPRSAKKNAFVNFTQRENNYAAMEQLELEYLKKNVKVQP